MQVTIAVPIYGAAIDPEIYRNHLLLVASSNGLVRSIAITQNELIHFARNHIVKEVLEDEFTNFNEDYILWLDQDIIVGPGTIRKLISDDKDIVSGLYFQKAPPFYPLILNQQKHQTGGVHSNILDYPEGLHQVDAIGFGCVLTKVNIFPKIPSPYFEWNMEAGEDINFCMKCKKYGIDVWYDSEVKCGHQVVDRKVITFDDFKPFKGKPFKLEMKNVR